MSHATTLRKDAPQRQLAAIRRWPSPEAKAWSRAAIDRLADDPAVDAVVAVGSAVRDAVESADVDFVVVYKDQKPQLGSRPLDVDLKLYERSRVEQLLAAGNDYLVWALRFGVPVFQRNHSWDSLQRDWRNKAPLPDPCQSDARAATAERYYWDLLAAGDDDAAQEQYLTMISHRARAALLRAGILGASRPELPGQLDATGTCALAAELRAALADRGR